MLKGSGDWNKKFEPLSSFYFFSESELLRPDAIFTLRIQLTAISVKFRVRIVKLFVGFVFVRFDLVLKAENSSQNFQQKWAFPFILILLTSFAKSPQDTWLSILASTVSTKGRENVCSSHVEKFQARSFSLPFKEAFDFLVQIESCSSMMFHVEFVFIGEMIINASLSEHRINAVVLSKKKIAQLFLAVKKFHLFC